MTTQTHPGTLDESQLLAGLLVRDPAAWREFHRRYDRMIWTCVHRVLTRFSTVVASDAMQEIRATFYASLFANDMHKLRSFEVERGNKLGTWIGLLAINATWDHLRGTQRRGRAAPLHVAERLHTSEPDPYAREAVRQECARLAEVVATLPPRDQAFVRLCFVDERSPQEIAAELGMDVKTVYSRKHRLTRLLRDAMRESSVSAAA